MQIHDRFDFEFEDRVEPVVSYMVCSQPRSGSSLLCELLANTLHAGMPAEYLRLDRMTMLKRRWSVETFDEYLRELVGRKTSPNGVCGLKAHWGQFEQVRGDPEQAAVFARRLPDIRYIHVRREDHLRQAISLVRALQTGTWSTLAAPADRSAVFDREDIARKIVRVQQEEAAWERFFEQEGIAAHRVGYEELANAPDQTTRGVLEFLGVELPPAFGFDPPLMQRQSDELSEEWVARYLSETAPADLT
jgi:LPS sulfotransferase NodH